MQKIEIPYYTDYISENYRKYLLGQATAVKGVENLLEVETGGGLETQQSLQFLCDIYQEIKPNLSKVLKQRIKDREFIDQRTKATYTYNSENDLGFTTSAYQTLIGQKDSEGRTVIGPLNDNYMDRTGDDIAPLPEHLKGPHVTLFGPPDNAKLSINAMNAYHRKVKGEPKIIEKILESNTITPKWGADDEDSKTPMRSDFIAAAVNLTDCLNKTLSFNDEKRGKKYELEKTMLAAPFKRFPGLALPCNFLFLNDSPLPLHLYDFVLHIFENWHNPEALTFYVPKLENEEEASYIHEMISVTERKIKELHSEYILGSVRLLIVLENPRAVFRVNEIMTNLYPYFAGASLGWHDYLGSTARLFKEDANYRIPVKADPDIVIKYIKGSHQLLARVVGPRGGIKIGGMYGILPIDNDLSSESFQITIRGFIRDVVTQFKRDLNGFWVAHPDFVRIGIALVVAWQDYEKGNKENLYQLVKDFVNPRDYQYLIDFIESEDHMGLDSGDSLFQRALIAADIEESDYIANNDPQEIRYNVFQTLQYLADWLRGNGCVALPSQIEGIPVRVMDDLATCERSRWEVWHELQHGRFELEDFLQIAFEEFNFIRRDLSDSKKIVQVKWDAETEKWYPLAFNLMIKLMTSDTPVEFAPELLLPFTNEQLRSQDNPWEAILEIDSKKYEPSIYIKRFNQYFEVCGDLAFAKEMAHKTGDSLSDVESIISNFNKSQIINASNFHGDIGASKKGLDANAKSEQASVDEADTITQNELCELGSSYKEKFGFKYLISAKGKTGPEMLAILKERFANTEEQEMTNAKLALVSITTNRLKQDSRPSLTQRLNNLSKEFKVSEASFSIQREYGYSQEISLGDIDKKTWLQFASLSKSVATAFSIEFLKSHGISLEDSVWDLLKKYESDFSFKSIYAADLKVKHLMSHNALNMHYVKGVELKDDMPSALELLQGSEKYGYEAIEILNKPGTKFNYSGGGFLLLEHLIEIISKQSIPEATSGFLRKLGMQDFSFDQKVSSRTDYLMFPAFAAGAMGTPKSLLNFLNHLTTAYQHLEGSSVISHDTAVFMLHGTDLGSRDFMGCDMGIGIFTMEAGPNTFALHQGANDGFRSIFLHCFDGPDAGMSLTAMSTGNNNAMLFLARATQEILKDLKPEGVDLESFRESFDCKNISQEEIVNYGYKSLVFDAFKETLPEVINPVGPKDPLAKFNLCVDAKISKVSNQKFARAQNLISEFLPIFDPELFGCQGKIMDSWETVRHNPKPFDSLELKLEKESNINYISISTKFHLGNQVKSICLLAFDSNKDKWIEFLPSFSLKGHALVQIKLPKTVIAQKIKVEIYPDGGLSRLGLYDQLPENEQSKFVDLNLAKSIIFDDLIPTTDKPLQLEYVDSTDKRAENLAAIETEERFNAASAFYGAELISASDEHYAPASLLISPYVPLSMFDGFESARSHNSEHQEVVEIKLACKTNISDLEFDFTYFVNNNPDFLSVEATTELASDEWFEVIARNPVKAFRAKLKSFELDRPVTASKIRLRIYPDGGVNRFKVFGTKA